MASVRLENVHKTYPNGHVAARGLDVAVEDGELLVLVGPSGCGKSTALRMVAGLERPTEGRVWIGERDCTDVPPQERDVAMVFQSYALYPHKTVAENLAFGLRVRRTPAEEIERRVGAAAASLGLETMLDRRPAQLSGGQRQRVALGRAIVRQPAVFLFDEPLSNLDARLRVETRAELSRLHRRLGTTMIYVTHDQEEAMTLGTRVAVLHEGRLQQLAPPLEIYRRPANLFVAGFVGSPAMNVIDGRVKDRGGVVSLLGPGLVVSGIEGIAPRDDVVRLGVRPRDVTVSADEPDLRARVEVVEPLGAETLLHARTVGNGDGFELRVVVPGDLRVAVDDVLPLRLRRDRLHLFDGATGVRLA